LPEKEYNWIAKNTQFVHSMDMDPFIIYNIDVTWYDTALVD
jgi:hypothetical protein